jgi:hypothetical protein
LPLGESALVTLVISTTCAAQSVPVDIVFVADESNSMRRGGTGGSGLPTSEATPGGPINTPPPPGLPTDDPRDPGIGDGEPAFCALLNPGGSFATATATPRFPPRRTRTPEPTDTPVVEPAGENDQIREMQTWLREFLENGTVEQDLAADRLRVGIVSFNTRVQVRQTLTNDGGRVLSAAGRMRGSDNTRINVGIAEAERLLNGSGSRGNAALKAAAGT